MVIEPYKVDISLKIKPHWNDVPPLARFTLDDDIIWDGKIEDIKSFDFTRYLAPGDHICNIELYDKPDLDGYQGLEILDLSFGCIRSRRFVWQGVYRPRYPEPWATEQKNKGIDLLSVLHNTDYLGWNGTWCLTFSCPIFTWIHRLENLGWIYD